MKPRTGNLIAVVVMLCATAVHPVGWIEDGKAPKREAEPDNEAIEQALKAIDWEASLDTALARAQEEKKPVLIEFHQSWHQWCRMLEEKTLGDEEISRLTRSFVCVRCDAEESQARVKQYGVKGYPTLVFLNSLGEPIHRVIGFIPPRPLEREMKEIARGREPEKELVKLEQSNPTEFKPLVMLAVGYLRRQEWDKAIATYERALAVGPGPGATEQQEVIYSLSQLYDFKKQPEKAERLLRDLLAVESVDKVKVHDMLGHLCLSQRRLEEAIEHFTAERNLVEDEKQREYLDRFIRHIRESEKRAAGKK